jgi:hypothetical protein
LARANQQANETVSATSNTSTSNGPTQHDEHDNRDTPRSTNLAEPHGTRTSSRTSDRDQQLTTPDHTGTLLRAAIEAGWWCFCCRSR